MSDRELRASTAERDAVADKLHAHASAGRLTASELSSRLEQVRAARTRGDLARLLSDLPVFRSTPAAFPRLRVSSAEREAVIVRLKGYHLEGRLSRQEYDERLEIALIAATYEELAHVLSDLPKPAPVPVRLYIPPAPVRTVSRAPVKPNGNPAAGCLGFIVLAGIIAGIMAMAGAFTSKPPPNLTGPAPAVPSWVVAPNGMVATDWTAMESDINNMASQDPSSGAWSGSCGQLGTDAGTAITDIESYNSLNSPSDPPGMDMYGVMFANIPQSTLDSVQQDAIGVIIDPSGCQQLDAEVLALMNSGAKWTPPSAGSN